MHFKRPLTADELRAIWQRNPKHADVQALVLEINRLRATVLRADQRQRLLGAMGGIPGAMLSGLRFALKEETCVTEQVRLNPKLLNR